MAEILNFRKPGDQVNIEIRMTLDGITNSTAVVRAHCTPDELHDLETLMQQTVHPAFQVLLLQPSFKKYSKIGQFSQIIDHEADVTKEK